MTVAVVFPGQGPEWARTSGRGWQGDALARELVERASAFLDADVSPLVFGTPGREDNAIGVRSPSRERLSQIRQVLLCLIAWFQVRGRLADDVVVAGHSLGQVAALIAVESLDLGEGIKFVRDREVLTTQVGVRTNGRMAAVLGCSSEEVVDLLVGVPECWVANDNSPAQVVLGGVAPSLRTVGRAIARAGSAKCVPLPVSGAFHTPLMWEAVEPLRGTVNLMTPATSSETPVYVNRSGRPRLDSDDWALDLADHVTTPVQWRQTVMNMVDDGVDAFVGLGATSSLLKFTQECVSRPLHLRAVTAPEDLCVLG